MRERLFGVACTSMLVYGIVLGLPGTVLGLPETAAELGLTLTSRGSLISALFVGLLVGSVVSGPVVHALGYRASLALSAALVAVTLPLLALTRTALLAGTAIIALGIAGAGMNTASNALSSDLFAGDRARRMNRLAIMAGLGGLMMPVATVAAAAVVSWRTIVVGGGVLAAMVALACAWVPPVDVPTSRSHSVGGAIRRFASQPGFLWLSAALLLGGANEASLAGWTSTYLQDAGFSAAASTWVLASHWLGLIVARITLAPRVERVKAAAVIRSALLGALAIAVLVLVHAPVWLAILPFAIGAAIALVVPTMLALAGDRYPGNPGALFGFLLTLLQIGGIALPSAIGFIADRVGLRHGMAIVVVSCLCVAAFVGLALHTDRIESGSTSEETA